MTDSFKIRCERAVKARGHMCLDGGATPEDIEEAFERAGLKLKKPGKLEMPVVEDVYTVNDETIIVEDDEKGSADPEFKLIDDAYQISQPGMVWFPLSIAANHGSAERIRKYVKRQGFLAYWPRRISIELRGMRGRKKKTTIVASLWPRYVLIHMPAKGTLLPPMPPMLDANEIKLATPLKAAFGQPFEAAFGAVRTPEGQLNGIGDWLKNTLGPIRIADRHVERIILRERAGEFNQTYRKGKKRMSKLPEWCVLGNIVRVVDGPFASFNGTIEEIDENKERLKVTVDIFGRPTMIDLELVQVSELC